MTDLGEILMTLDVVELNTVASGKTSQAIIKTILEANTDAFVSTNFGPNSAVLLHMLTQVNLISQSVFSGQARTNGISGGHELCCRWPIWSHQSCSAVGLD